MVAKLDPVAKRLAESKGDQTVNLVQWMDGKRARNALLRRAFWCVLGAWLLVTMAAIIATFVSFMFTRNANHLFGGDNFFVSIEIPRFIAMMPYFFGGVSAVLLIGGVIAWVNGNFPGLSMTKRALDWTSSSDAVSRLLSVGCTYPEAFKLAAAVSVSPNARRWLTRSAQRVEQGAPIVGNPPSRGDASIVELFVESEEQEPSAKWRLTSDHFAEVAHRRVSLLFGFAPVMATLLSGLIVWLSVSTTLGWMWRSTITSLGQF